MKTTYINRFICLATFVLFTLSYFSFFPGRYSPDSFAAYAIAFGIDYPVDVACPSYALFWLIGHNYNFSPFVVQYLLLIIALFLIYKRTQSTIIPLLIFVLFLTPPLFLTYTFVWKDNALLSVLLLYIAVLIQKPSWLTHMVGIGLLIFASLLRVNAIFAVLPLLGFYIHHVSVSTQKKIILFLLMSLAVIGIDNIITYHVIRASRATYTQQFYVTDIEKINHRLGIAMEVPDSYRTNTTSENIKTVFKQYEKYPSNDYFYYKLLPGFDPIFKIDKNKTHLSALKKQWLQKIMQYPSAYTENRLDQWYRSISDANYSYGDNFNVTAIGNVEHRYKDKIYLEPQNFLMTHIRHYYDPHYQNQFHIYNFFLAVSKPIVYFSLNVIFLLFLFLNNKPIAYRALIISLLLSGILYIAAYIPILPTADFRYFTWVIITFWLSLGFYLIALKNEYWASKRERR